MSSSPTEPIPFPQQARTGPFDPPEVFGRLRDECPLRPLTFADGHEGWLATGYPAVRAILADRRFGSRVELRHPPVDLAVMTEFYGKPADPGMFQAMDPPEHTRYRRPLIAEFGFRRMKQLEPRITEVTLECLDAMEASGPPVDLVQAFALPIPSLVICELLGVPYADRGDFQRAMAIVTNWETPEEEMHQALAAMKDFFPPLIRSKRERPTDDLFSGLVNGGDLTDEELTNIGLVLFGAGFETTANMLGLGAFALLQHPEQLAVIRDDAGIIDDAVEELLRYLTIVHFGPQRTALEDVRIDGTLIKKGQSVMLSVAAANRDPARFHAPDRLDLRRSAHGHLAFGHGVHQCLGQPLARTEMRIAFAALFDRFPDLRLAVPPEEVPTKETSSIYGVRRLPVAW